MQYKLDIDCCIFLFWVCVDEVMVLLEAPNSVAEGDGSVDVCVTVNEWNAEVQGEVVLMLFTGSAEDSAQSK